MARALIIVDYQNDFARPDGALSVPAVRGVNVEPGDSERALEELQAAGATVA